LIKCATWLDASDLSADCSKVIPEFHGNEPLTDWAREYARIHAGRLRWDVDFLIQNYKFSNCLNIGGAPFIFEYLLKKARPDLAMVSFDLHPERYPEAGRVLDIKIVQIDIEKPDPAAKRTLGQFECVVFCEVFEHLRMNILETISSLKDLLTADGILYLTTPNGVGLYAIWEALHGRTGSDPVNEWSKLTRIGHMGHVREYSRKEVCDVFRQCGFVLETQLYRRARRSGTVRSRMANVVKGLATSGLPWLGDELVFVFRKAP
jgi:hypothetical protein